MSDAVPRNLLHVKAAALAAVVVIIWMCIMMIVVPRLEVVLNDMKMELPAGTRLLLAMSRWMSGVGWLVVLVIPPAVGYLVKRAGGGRHVIVGLMTLALGAIVLVTVLGVFLPLVRMMESLGTAK
jgi:type II secretory pathway component PulF